MTRFKKALREYIRENGISQEYIAERIGTSQQAVSDFINSDRNPQRRTREKYFEVLEGFKDYFVQENNTRVQVYGNDPIKELEAEESFKEYNTIRSEYEITDERLLFKLGLDFATNYEKLLKYEWVKNVFEIEVLKERLRQQNDE